MATKSYKPAAPFATAMVLLIPEYTDTLGVATKRFPDVDEGIQFFGTFRSYGGTERDVNGVYSIEDTATIDTWFNPYIKSGCQIFILGKDVRYEIINEPEVIELRNQFMRFKVKRVKGGA